VKIVSFHELYPSGDQMDASWELFLRPASIRLPCGVFNDEGSSAECL